MSEKTVFVVSDSDDLQHVLRMLRNDGFRAIGVGDCESAERILESIGPVADLVITDYPRLHLPGAPDRCRCAKPYHKSRRTLALISDNDLRPVALAEGYHEVYVRPVAGPAFLPVVRDLVR